MTRVKLPTQIFKEGVYIIQVRVGTDKNISDPNATVKFKIINTKIDMTNKSYHPERQGLLFMDLEWKTSKNNIMATKKLKKCLICKSPLYEFIDFGKMPIANGFLSPEQFKDEYFFQPQDRFLSEVLYGPAS